MQAKKKASVDKQRFRKYATYTLRKKYISTGLTPAILENNKN